MASNTTGAMTQSLVPDDVLSAILALAARKRGNRLEFRAHDSKLQNVFRELAERFEFVRSQFVFSDSGPERFSPTLNESFARLQLAGLIGRQNPDYEVVFLRPEADAYYARRLEPRLDKTAREELQKIADAFAERIELV